MGKAGDGQQSGFEGSFWNWTRSDEKNALVAQDRADEKQAKADMRKELSDGDSEIQDIKAQTATAVTQWQDPPQKGGGRRQVADAPARKQLERHHRLHHHHERVHKAHTTEIEDLAARVDALESKAAETFDMAGGWVDALLSWTGVAVSVLNVNDRPAYPSLVMLARALEGLELTPWGAGKSFLRIVSNLALIAGYYNSRIGFSSLFGPDRVRPPGGAAGTIAGLLASAGTAGPAASSSSGGGSAFLS